ncbi:MAG: hypothetical protein MJ053_03910 [Elusimicrobiaceae bacterium]|nr:hypothetical protein [Elusimicrobiaceae bacterium]
MIRTYSLCAVCLFLFTSAQAASVKTVFWQAIALLPAQLQHAPNDFPTFLRSTQTPVAFSRRSPGALAEYRASSCQIIFFKRPLARWLVQARLQVAEEHLPELLARCLAPIYVHELSHAQDQAQSRMGGFAWPVTLEDEYVASFWQLYFMQAAARGDSSYYELCAPLLPPESYRNLAPCEAKTAIYQTYASAAKDRLPPPLTLSLVQQLLRGGKINFALHEFTSQKPSLSILRFVQQGGNWLRVTPAELQTFTEGPVWDTFQALRSRRLHLLQQVCQK